MYFTAKNGMEMNEYGNEEERIAEVDGVYKLTYSLLPLFALMIVLY